MSRNGRPGSYSLLFVGVFVLRNLHTDFQSDCPSYIWQRYHFQPLPALLQHENEMSGLYYDLFDAFSTLSSCTVLIHVVVVVVGGNPKTTSFHLTSLILFLPECCPPSTKQIAAP